MRIEHQQMLAGELYDPINAELDAALARDPCLLLEVQVAKIE